MSDGEIIFGTTDSYVISVNLGMFVVVLVIFALVYIFRYGAVLQQESDDTL